jgi:signal transduction histidine kinase
MTQPPFEDEVPAVLADLETVAAAHLGPDGRVIDANAGFLALLEDVGPADRVDARELVLGPSFDELAEGGPSWELRHEGLIHVGGPQTDAVSLSGTVHGGEDGLVLLAEFDVAGERKTRERVVELNEELQETQRELRRELTARERAERELEEKAEALERSNQRLEEYAYVISHDLQEPLRAVASYLDLLERALDDGEMAKVRERLAEARAGATRMEEMIDGLLTYARVGTNPTEAKPVALGDVVDDVLADLKLRVEETGADVRVGSLPRVRADEGQLGHLFQNLVANALDHAGPSPTIEIAAESVDEETTRCYVVDDGPGIPEQDRDQLFDLFERGASADGDGTGIGLAVCRRIVERHGGQLEVASSPGEGTRFSFTLPTASPEEDRMNRGPNVR